MLAAHGNTKHAISCCCHMRFWVPSTCLHRKTSWPDWLVNLEPLWCNLQGFCPNKYAWRNSFISDFHRIVSNLPHTKCEPNQSCSFGSEDISPQNWHPLRSWRHRFIHLQRPRNWKNSGLMNAAHNGFRTTRSSRWVGSFGGDVKIAKSFYREKKMNILTQPGEWSILRFATATVWGWSWKSQRLSNQLACNCQFDFISHWCFILQSIWNLRKTKVWAHQFDLPFGLIGVHHGQSRHATWLDWSG